MMIDIFVEEIIIQLKFMKKLIIYLFLFSFLLQSCYSYRKLDLTTKPFVEGKKYQIKQSGNFEKFKLISQTDTSIVVNKNKTQIIILKNEIIDIKEKRLSVVKTILLPIGILAIGAGAIIHSFSSLRIGY